MRKEAETEKCCFATFLSLMAFQLWEGLGPLGPHPCCAYGFNLIPAKFIKITACVLTPFLRKIFKKIVEQETFSNDYKIAFVIPIPKVSSPQTFGDF